MFMSCTPKNHQMRCSEIQCHLPSNRSSLFAQRAKGNSRKSLKSLTLDFRRDSLICSAKEKEFMSATHNVEQMREHIMSLIKRHDIVVEWCRRPTQASAIHVAEEIRIAPIQSAISYATALHEIGHIVGQHQRSQNSMVREHWAWHW